MKHNNDDLSKLWTSIHTKTDNEVVEEADVAAQQIEKYGAQIIQALGAWASAKPAEMLRYIKPFMGQTAEAPAAEAPAAGAAPAPGAAPAAPAAPGAAPAAPPAPGAV